METLSGEGQDDVCDVTHCPGPATANMSEDSTDKNLFEEHMEHFDRSSKAVGSDITTEDTAADRADVCDGTESLHECGENATDAECVGNSKPAELLDDGLGKFEDISETRSDDAAVTEDDGWMYVLGHDQLKKRACIVYSFFPHKIKLSIGIRRSYVAWWLNGRAPDS